MKSVSGALTVLGVALAFVYVVFFGVHGTDFANDPVFEQIATATSSVATGPAVQGLDEIFAVAVQEQAAADIDKESDQPAELPTGTTEVAPDTGRTVPERSPQEPASDNVTFYSVQELFSEENVEQPNYLALSGTHRWEGVVKSLELLGLQDDAEYILKDNLNTHYVYLGKELPDIESSVLTLSGNMVEIGDNNAIKQHVLFGDSVWFINLPMYEQVKVLMIVLFEEQNDVRFLQVDHDSYYKIKPQLQKTFGMFYDRGE